MTEPTPATPGTTGATAEPAGARVLFTTWAAPSHLYPMVPLAWAFQAAGHQVRVAVPPGCVRAVADAGLTPVPVGPDPDIAGHATSGGLAAWHTQGRWPDDWAARADELSEAQQGILRALGEKQLRIAGAMADDLLGFARAWRPDLVVQDAGTYAGTLAAADLGVPAVAHLWGSPAVMRLNRAGLDGPHLDGYRALFERYGLEPAEPGLWVDPCPPSLTLPSPVTRVPTRFVPYNGPGGAPESLLPPSGKPRVCLTWGVTADRLKPGGPALPPPLLAAAHELTSGGAEVLLAVTEAQRERLGAQPDGVHTVSGVPLRLLLPGCDAVVHQGGGGTTMTATEAGVPQLILSPRPEQMLTGARLAAAGAARHRPLNEVAGMPDTAAPGALLAADVRALLDDPAHRAAAGRLRAEARALPTPAEVAGRLIAEARATTA
ncbi:DUF1205 domain-containing protein [Streptomyces sp. BG9H]|uniref:DUF1205 domain-containing protein n=1 Tax=Streptomyces anatolicus TaxID=2675858 RepID=A0ABS6YUY6_9ACTN|nr:nucleotide disphospho-sugar-binding domain-containing protein [Streptomyces anatolicus]MBW5425251.1 DUF1205 domain-containing protein [Streptomyces anatolicus]